MGRRTTVLYGTRFCDDNNNNNNVKNKCSSFQYIKQITRELEYFQKNIIENDQL